jgi:hypothetical protein
MIDSHELEHEILGLDKRIKRLVIENAPVGGGSSGGVGVETDPVFAAWLLATPPLYPGGWYDAVQNTIGLSGFDNDSGFITSFDDEKVKYDAGDSTAGYVADKIIAGTGISVAEGTGANENKLVVTSDITQYTDSDAIAAIQGDASWNASDWDTAYGWGNHAGLYLPIATVLPSTETGASNNFLTAYNSTTGAFSKAQPTWADIDKTTSDIADITTKSHTSLTDIGTLTHATIDSYLDQAVKVASSPKFASVEITDAGRVGFLGNKAHIQFDDEAVDTISMMYANIGVGTTTPAPFVAGSTCLDFTSTNNMEMIFDHTDAGVGSVLGDLNFARADTLLAQIRGAIDGANDAAYISITTKPTGGALTERMRITSNGNVGVGVTPVVQLDVAGSATNGKSLQLRSGDGATGTDSNQIIFSYNNKPYNSGGYAHAIKTTHDNSSAAGNTISFWLRDHGTDNANTIGTKKVLELNGAGLVYAPTKIQVGSASSALTGEVLKGAYNGVTVSSPIGLGIENTGTSGSGQGAGSVWYSNDGAAMASGDRLGFLLFGGSSSSSALRNTGGILAYATQNWTDGSAYGTKVSIETVDNNATSRTETVSFRGTLAYFSGEVSAFSFTDRTPSYEGDALSALSKVKSKDGQIDHSTLPKEARVIKEVSKNIYEKGVMVGQEIVEEEGRDLGMMISILTKAVQQLRSEINILKGAK